MRYGVDPSELGPSATRRSLRFSAVLLSASVACASTSVTNRPPRLVCSRAARGHETLDALQEEFYEYCCRSNAPSYTVESMVGVDGPHRFCRACPHRTDELP